MYMDIFTFLSPDAQCLFLKELPWIWQKTQVTTAQLWILTLTLLKASPLTGSMATCTGRTAFAAPSLWWLLMEAAGKLFLTKASWNQEPSLLTHSTSKSNILISVVSTVESENLCSLPQKSEESRSIGEKKKMGLKILCTLKMFAISVLLKKDWRTLGNSKETQTFIWFTNLA